MDRPSKRQKLGQDHIDASDVRTKRANFLASLSRDVSPPSDRVAIKGNPPSKPVDGTNTSNVIDLTRSTSSVSTVKNGSASIVTTSSAKVIPSPVQLTRIHDLPEQENRDTVSLTDILGDPLIKEVWIFNFCFDVDWLMQHFDSDTRHLVKVKIVHGSWRREDPNKVMIDEACGRLANVDAIQAYLPDAFGTHHSKMFILFRHDETAQVVIHTANMLEKDWKNMTQAVWRSPMLPVSSSSEVGDIGSGSRFKYDLLRYLKSYGSKLKGLVSDLDKHSFDDVKAALVASVPSKLKTRDANVWGHEALRRAVTEIPISSRTPHFVFQVSSIASLPATWLKDTLYRAINSSAANTSIIFPTAEDVRISLDGYYAGASIHTKAQSDTHLKQISALRPQLCRWASSGKLGAGRLVAAPHIKTYIRFAGLPTKTDPNPSIEWALVTSANLSTQAWGSAAKPPKGSKDISEAMIHIQSYEIGVMVWPALFAGDGAGSTMKMLPSFGTDSAQSGVNGQEVVGFRMPYDLPLTPYGNREMPWSPHSSYSVPDSHGLTWPPAGY